MYFLFFIISLVASITGAISGIGGGIIIKPFLDATQLMSVSTINFLSACTVLSMSTVSILRNRNGSIRVDLKISLFLGIGAALGGILGKELFQAAIQNFSAESVVGAIQSIILLLITVFVFLYIQFKDRIPSRNMRHPLLAISIGLSLGMISSFLGIGGGPLNIAFLYYFFSMDGKTAALNSLFVIFISQIFNIFSTLAIHKVPHFDLPVLCLMIFGGILGALIGCRINQKISNKTVEIFFSCVLFVIAMINIWNFFRFLQMG